MKIGSFEWKPLGFLHEKIENTRFLLTIINELEILFFGGAVLYLIIAGITVEAVTFGLVNLIVGYLIGSGQLAKKSYFDSRNNNTTGNSESEAISEKEQSDAGISINK